MFPKIKEKFLSPEKRREIEKNGVICPECGEDNPWHNYAPEKKGILVSPYATKQKGVVGIIEGYVVFLHCHSCGNIWRERICK